MNNVSLFQASSRGFILEGKCGFGGRGSPKVDSMSPFGSF